MKALTQSQWDALESVIKSNGGGVRLSCTVDKNTGEIVPSQYPWRALFSQALIQGKAGADQTVVHTRKGLELWKATQ